MIQLSQLSQLTQLTKKRVASFTWAIILFINMSPTHAQANLALKEWSEVLSTDRLQVIDQIGSKLPNVIFDWVSNIDTRLYSSTHFDLNLSVHRNVFNNREVHGTWTVVDKVGVSGQIPFFSIPSIPTGSPVPSLGLYIGTQQGVEFINIRQVKPKNYPSLPSPEERKLQLETDINFKNFTENRKESMSESSDSLNGKWIESINEKGDKIMSFLPADGESLARYSRFWNFSLIPFRLPLNYETFSKMEEGEILSYLGQGSVELGLNAGWGLSFQGIGGIAEAGISASAILRGQYRISILRESDHIARVKVTRSKGIEAYERLGANYKPSLFDNIFIIRDVNNLLKVIPFQLSYEQVRDWEVDVTYQYDLSIPAARAAYENSVLGLFKQSEDLATNAGSGWRTDLAETGVIRLSTRDSYTSSETLNSRLQLSFLFKKDSNGTITDVESRFTMPDGKHHTFSSLAENTKEWSLIWSRYEKSQHNFSIHLDLDTYSEHSKKRNAFPLIIEGRIDNSNTSARDLLNSILEVENNIGKPDLFPRTVELDHLKGAYYYPFHFQGTNHDLGSSHIYYQLKLNPWQVQKFIDFPKRKMWKALEKAFHVPRGSWSTDCHRLFCCLLCLPVTAMDVPLNLFQMNIDPGTDLIYARWIKNQWMNLKKIKNTKDRAEALVHMFSDRLYSKTLIYLIRTVLEGENISYYVNATNGAIGKVVAEGGTKLVYDDIATRANESIEFDLEGSRLPRPDPNLKIDHFSAIPIDSDRVQISFNLTSNPKKLYFDLSLDNGLLMGFRNQGISALILENHGELHEGRNTFILDPNDFGSPLIDISRTMQQKGYYTLRISASTDGTTWGETAETKFNH